MRRHFLKSVRVAAPVAAALAFAIGVAAALPASPRAAEAPAAPAGLTAIALDGQVGLAWKAVDGATSYSVFRGTSAGAINTEITPADYTGTSFADTSASNGTTYFYAVRASSADGQSVTAQTAKATPRARSCSTGNAIKVENCFPGTTAWKTPTATRAFDDGIEGYASSSSINAGQSVDLHVRTDWDVPYHIEVYRTGGYGGIQGRLVSVIPGLTGVWPPGCEKYTDTGLIDCSTWDTSATLTTTSDWVSGVYLLKLVRDDNGNANEIILVVRHDGSHSDVLYQLPTMTYQAYNSMEGKALYTGISDPPATLTGANRAVKVSFDRPYAQPEDHSRFDWFTRTDVADISWLESQGYDVSYIADEDLHTDGAQAQDHHVLMIGSHDEYWSQEMVDAVKDARDAGTSVFFLGANMMYWKVRFEASPLSGRANRVMVTYKTVESGPADPTGAKTSTWRDPNGPNQPENGLIGQMYVGQNIDTSFPIKVSAGQGKDRVWRYTGLGDQAAGATASIGTSLVGWEWDSRVDNGLEPAGVVTLAASPVSGYLSQGNGASESLGSAIAMVTKYKVASGATVFATGTNQWWRGLATNEDGVGEPNTKIQQATANLLADMGAVPTTPAGSLVVDAVGSPAVTTTVPSNGSTGAVPNASIKVTLDRELDPATIDDADITVKDPSDVSVPGTVSYDGATKTLTFNPDEALEPFTEYTATLGTGVKTWQGTAPSSAHAWTFSTGQGTAPVVNPRTPASAATGVATDIAVKARFDRRLDDATVTGSTVTLTSSSGTPVAAGVSYDDSTRTVTLQPTARLIESTTYTVHITSGVQARDGVAAVADSWSFTTGVNLRVTGRTPAALATGMSPSAVVRAVFSRDADGSSLTTSSFKLLDPDGDPVAATVSYDGAARTATLTPASALDLNTTYTVQVLGAVRAADGNALEPATWTFTTAASAPPGPVATELTPVSDAQGVPNTATLRVAFDIPLDPATVTAQTFTLTPAGGSPVAATVSYDAAAGEAVLNPVAPLATATTFTATLTTGVRSTTGAPQASTTSWSFATSNCPCQLMKDKTPALTGLPVQDYRPGSGPFTYELGTRITSPTAATLVSVRFFKDSLESGTHVGRVWSSTGTLLESVTFQNETASGWQRQALPTPISMTPGATYVVSVGLNSTYAKTPNGLQNQIVSGPLRSVADGSNGVYNNTAGSFPNSSWAASNYYVDGVVTVPSAPIRTPSVVSTTPTSAATGVAVNTKVKATFNLALDGSTVNVHTFTLTDDGMNTVPATVSYDEDKQTATLTPADPLETGATYTARLGTGVKSDGEVALSSAYSWTFTSVPPAPPTVTATSPTDGSTLVSGLVPVTATFSTGMDASTLTTSSFTLTGPGGAVSGSVSYDALTRTASFTPAAALTASTEYTATLATTVKSSRNVNMAAARTWSFTTSACPCRLFNEPVLPTFTDLDTRNYRAGTGPFTLELGLKVHVTQPARLEAVRFLKDDDETGSHTARVWTSDGTLITSEDFTGETASGWQEQTLSTPVDLVPGQTYVVSVGVNSRFGMTGSVFGSELISGPLRSVADGHNGVYGDAAGAFPNQDWGNSNYFVDAVVR
jgi:hypothetical protein